MKLEALLSGLQNPQPAVRLDIVRVLGMVDEVGALAALREHYQAEGDPVVRSAIAWAGKRLYQAQQAGYSTQAEIFRFFGVDREIEATPDAAEAELMEKLERDLESTLQNRQQRSNVKQAGIAAATGLGVGLVAGGMMGLGTMMGGMKQGASAASSNLGSSDRPDPGSKRTPAMKPSTTDFKVWLRRLLESSNDAQREQAIIEIQQLNNPAALPHLAAVFVSDNSPKIRESAQRFGKILYWSSVYWDMEQSGALEAEIKRRLEELGKRTEKPAIPSPNQADSGTAPRAASEPPPPSSQV
ncbi:MAG: HEAT repeat domain-containing protein, partial [Anaerolineae bacterium]|nr:HEAT repeat domain-containing protein [Anaerolineae bacterium]